MTLNNLHYIEQITEIGRRAQVIECIRCLQEHDVNIESPTPFEPRSENSTRHLCTEPPRKGRKVREYELRCAELIESIELRWCDLGRSSTIVFGIIS